MRRKVVGWTVGSLGLLAAAGTAEPNLVLGAGPGPAVAQAGPSLTAVDPPPMARVEPEPTAVTTTTTPRWASGFGWAIMAGGAYEDFTNSTMRNTTAAGGAWDARFIGGTNSIIGFEAAYVGAARSLNTLGVTANNPALVSNGLEGNLRLNAPIRRGSSLFEPYGYLGLGYQHYNVSNYNSNTQVVSSFRSSDDTMTVPVGGGFAYAYKAFIADVRGGWTGVYYNDLLRTGTNVGSGSLNHWNVGGQAGFLF